MSTEPWTTVLVGLAALATSAMTAVLGFGGGLVLLAVLLLWADPVVAIPLHAAVQVVSNATRTWIRRCDVDRAIVLPFCVLLIPAGAVTLPLVVRAPDSILQAAIAVTVIAATWWPELRGTTLRPPSRWGWVAVGGVVGALNVMVGATGPLQAPLFRSATRTRQAFVGTFAASQVAGHATKLALFGVAGLAPTRYAGPAVAGVVGVLAGTAIGSRVLDRISEERFRSAYLAAITGVSLYLLASAVVQA